MLKILHTGDIHLDSPFSGLGRTRSESRRNELRSAFTSMMTYAKMNNVDLILVSGDVFDGEFVTRETISLLVKEFEKFEKPVFIAPGNHDCASPNSVWKKDIFPKNVHVFSDSSLSSVDVADADVTVYGYAFTEPNLSSCPIKNETVMSPDRINLLVAHADMTSKDGTNCPVTPAELEYFGADYAALGHVHNPPSPGKDNRYCYCGCLEPRAFDELGPKGALIVEIDKAGESSKVVIKPVRFSKRRYERGELTLDGAETQADVNKAVADYIAENRYGEDTILQLRLNGYIYPSLLIDTEGMDGPDFGIYSLTVEDNTRPEIDTEALENDLSIRGEVYRQLKPALFSEDEREREVGRRALRYAFSSLAGDNI